MASSPDPEPHAGAHTDGTPSGSTVSTWILRVWRNMWITYGILWAVILGAAGIRWLIPKVSTMSADDWIPFAFIAACMPIAWYIHRRARAGEDGAAASAESHAGAGPGVGADDDGKTPDADGSDNSDRRTRLQSVWGAAQHALRRVSQTFWMAVGILFLVALLQHAIIYTLTWTWSPGRTAFTVMLALLCLWTLALFAAPSFRNGYVKGADSVLIVIAAIVAMSMTAAGAFAGMTREALAWTDTSLRHGGDEHADVTPDGLIGFYYWHLFNALPGQPLSTLRIEAPYDYTSTWVGAFVLIYSMIVIVPILAWVGAVIHWRRIRREAAQATAREPGSPGGSR